MPFWQAQMLVDELVADGIPAVMTEDFGRDRHDVQPRDDGADLRHRGPQGRRRIADRRDHRHPPGPPPPSEPRPSVAPNPVCVRIFAGTGRRFSRRKRGLLPRGRDGRPRSGMHDELVSDRAIDRKGCSARRRSARRSTSRNGSGANSSAGWLDPGGAARVRVRGVPETHRYRLRLGLLCLGERSWVSYEAAATLHGLDRSKPDAVEFTVDRNRRDVAIDLPFTVHTTDDAEADRLRRGRRLPHDVGDPDDHRPRPRPCAHPADRSGDRQCGPPRPLVAGGARRSVWRRCAVRAGGDAGSSTS